MGTLVSSWMQKKNIKYITFSVTDDCNLMCKYCYFTHKTSKNKMTFEVAKASIDYILSEPKFLIHDGVVWDFIGGEPTLELDLIDQICEYILYKMYTENHKWLYCYRFMIGSNGLLYKSEKFQRMIAKYNRNLHINITVDGSKEKHDLSRIKRDGTGSYDDVVSVLPLWFKQIGNYSTKATFSHEDLPYLKDSIINLWNIGFKNVMANVVFEDVWQEGDDVILEEQLRLLADYIIENKLWDSVSVRFFSPQIGFPLDNKLHKVNTCGSGNMMAIDQKGNFFPCVRFLDSALNNKKGRTIGNYKDGVQLDKIRAFNALSYDSQSPSKCIDCDIASGCSWCTGLNYDESKNHSIFERQIHLCEMHHATVRANRYFWKKYETVSGMVSPLRYNTYTVRSDKNRYLYIYYDNSGISTCPVNFTARTPQKLTDDDYHTAIELCDALNLIPVHIGFPTKKQFGYYIGSAKSTYQRDDFTLDVVSHDDLLSLNINALSKNIIYQVNYNQLDVVFEDMKVLIGSRHISKITLNVMDYHMWTANDLRVYNSLINQLADMLFEEWTKQNYLQIDVITDNLFLTKHNFCSSGLYQWSVAPDGNLYHCIGSFFDGDPAIEKVSPNIDIQKLLSSHVDLTVCNSCTANHCKKCYHLNKKNTEELDVPFEIHCVKANLELTVSARFLNTIQSHGMILPFDVKRRLNPPEYLDPLVELYGEDSVINHKYYSVFE